MGKKISHKIHGVFHRGERGAAIFSINACCKEIDTVRRFLVFSLGNDWQALALPQLSAGTQKETRRTLLNWQWSSVVTAALRIWRVVYKHIGVKGPWGPKQGARKWKETGWRENACRSRWLHRNYGGRKAWTMCNEMDRSPPSCGEHVMWSLWHPMILGQWEAGR